MSIPAVCPVCQAKFPIEAGINDAHARQAIATAIKLPPPLGDHILRYMALFAPQSRAITMDRLARLLNELTDQITSGELKRDGRRYKTSTEVWAAGLQEVLDGRDRWRLPLKTHGLLFALTVDHANKYSAQLEQSNEKKLQTRARQSGPTLLDEYLQVQSNKQGEDNGR